MCQVRALPFIGFGGGFIVVLYDFRWAIRTADKPRYAHMRDNALPGKAHISTKSNLSFGSVRMRAGLLRNAAGFLKTKRGFFLSPNARLLACA